MELKGEEPSGAGGMAAFVLIYFTFFLDNVLLTVLVPIIPDWVGGGEALRVWARQDAPLAALLNATVTQIQTSTHQQRQSGIGRATAVVGVVLGAKAAVQLAAAGPAAVLVCRLGPAAVLRAATGLLATAAFVFCVCAWLQGSGGWVVCAVLVGRGVHGAGAAGAGVAGLALAAALPPPLNDRALPALLGAVALGVLIGYPFGGAASSILEPGTPFLLLAMAFVANLGLQQMFLGGQQFNMPAVSPGDTSRLGFTALARCARRGAAGACAGCVLLTTSVMAALEPLLPLWLREHFHSARWQAGLAFLPDSTGYLLAASTLGACARRVGAERVALTGQLCVGVSALLVPCAVSPWLLAPPQLVLGAGLGAVDAALVPALLARAGPRRAAARAALFQCSGSAAYALGPAVGGGLAWAAGAGAALGALGALNLLYAAFLYTHLAKHPLSEQWGASPESESDEEDAELAPLRYSRLVVR